MNSSSTALDVVVQAQPHDFRGTCGTSFNNPAGNQADPLLKSGTNPALPKSFRSHLTLKMFSYELPTLSFSSDHLEDFVRLSSSLTNSLSPDTPDGGPKFTALLGRGFVALPVTGLLPQSQRRGGLQIWEAICQAEILHQAQ